ncbi:MAG: hypothetical protein AAFZ15_27635 [Bacteroidota bacterium]
MVQSNQKGIQFFLCVQLMPDGQRQINGGNQDESDTTTGIVVEDFIET